MAVTLKSRQHIAELRKAGRLVAQTYEELRPHIVPGISTAELDRIAEEFIRSKGATPMYKGYAGTPGHGRTIYPPFPATICVAINDVICHGIPSPKEQLRDGDIVGIDIGVLLNGWVGDACVTFTVGQVTPEAQRLVDVTRECLQLGIEQARPGRRLGDVGAAIQSHAEAAGFSVVREYHGHGVGRALWEDPVVLHWGSPGTGLKLQPGMVFTIEPMINVGRPETRLMPDRWTVRTADGSLSAQFEHSLAITNGAPQLLTVP
jgi:methionyl aminopeptidase